MEQISQSIKQVDGSYSTVTDIKRQNPSFSRKWILKHLHRTGYRYHKLPKRRRVEKSKRYRSKHVLAVVSHLAQSLVNNTVSTYYIDEVHFPLEQTATSHWTRDSEICQEMVYNRRQVEPTKVSTIAMCNLEKIVAVQFFTKDITADDFLYFVQEALCRLHHASKVTILADQASWHTAESISSARAIKFLHLNAPGLFESNAIENCFSFIRAGFRKRPLVSSVDQEARLLLEIFFDPNNPKRLAGIARNHIRTLLSLLYHHHMSIVTQAEGEDEASSNDHQ